MSKEQANQLQKARVLARSRFPTLFGIVKRTKLIAPTFLLESRYETLVPGKKEIIDFACTRLNIKSFADLGGWWNVHGGYTFYTMDKFRIQNAILVDESLDHAILNEKKQNKYPKLRVLKGNFGSKDIAREIGNVDAILLFDILLHQVSPNWDEVLGMYSNQTKHFIIYNQQFIASDRTVRLLELGEGEYFRNVPAPYNNKYTEPYKTVFEHLNEVHPVYQRPYRDLYWIWQWGIVDDDLLRKMRELGYKMQYYKNCGRFGDLENFEDHAFVFSRVE